MQTSLVSIIIPTYNAERWLGEAIDSALAQTWPEIEVIVVDDASEDESVAVARGYGSDVRVLETDRNGGPAVARNRGIAAARGTWIQFLDADDLLLPQKVERCIESVKDDASSLPFSLSRTFYSDVPGRRRRLWNAISNGLRLPDEKFDADDPLARVLGGRLQTHQWLHRASVLRSVGGFRPHMRWLEDVDLNVRLALTGLRFHCVPEALVLMREHNSPGRQRFQPGSDAQRVRNELLMLDTIEQAGRLTPTVRRIMANRLGWAGRRAWRAGHHELATSAFDRARSLHPSPNVSGVSAYNRVANFVGLERMERLIDRFV